MGDGGLVLALFGTVGTVFVFVRAGLSYQRYVERGLIQRGDTFAADLAEERTRSHEKDLRIHELEGALDRSERDRRHAVERKESLAYELARTERQLDELVGEHPRHTRTRKTDPTPEVDP